MEPGSGHIRPRQRRPRSPTSRPSRHPVPASAAYAVGGVRAADLQLGALGVGPAVRRPPGRLPAWKDPTQPQPQPTGRAIAHLFRILREAGRLPDWAAEPPARTRNRVVQDVERAWRNFFPGRSARPRPKRRSDRPAFYLSNQSARFQGRTVRVGKLGTLRLARAPRYAKHKVMSATVSTSTDAGTSPSSAIWIGSDSGPPGARSASTSASGRTRPCRTGRRSGPTR